MFRPAGSPCFMQWSGHSPLICSFDQSTPWDYQYWPESYVTGIGFIGCDSMKTPSQVGLWLALDLPSLRDPCSEDVLYCPNPSTYPCAYSFCNCTLKTNLAWCLLCPPSPPPRTVSVPAPVQMRGIAQKRQFQSQPAPDITLNFTGQL